MNLIPDLDDPRYLDELGWFLQYEQDAYGDSGRTYAQDRLEWSEMLLDNFLDSVGHDREWIRDKTVVSVGSGCSGDLCAWPVASKVVVEPLAYTYQKLDMLLADKPGTSPTVYLSQGIEHLPLLDGCADAVICRNALDHMMVPGHGLAEIWRILKLGATLYLRVDIGGEPCPDEPSPFARESLIALLEERFEILTLEDGFKPHSSGRDYSVKVIARAKPGLRHALDKKALLQKYEIRCSSGGTTAG